MEVIESIGGLVSSMLDFPLANFLGRLLPAGGSEAGQQVATAFGAGLHNLGSLCSQAGLDRWELLGLAVLSAITVYRKELSSNSVYNGKGVGDGGGRNGGGGSGGGGHYHRTDCGDSAAVVHVDGCHIAVAAAAAAAAAGAEAPADDKAGTGAGKPCMCARIAALQRQRASIARRLRATEDERKLKRLVAGRIRSMNLSVNHLQQLRASVDASWSSLATAWDARRVRGNSSSSRSSRSQEAAGGERERAKTVPLPLSRFEMPPCPHHSHTSSRPHSMGGGVQQQQERRVPNAASYSVGKEKNTLPKAEAGCAECSAIAAAHLTAASLLHGSIQDGNVATDGGGGTGGFLLSGEDEVYDLWAGSSLGVLPEDALHRVVAFLPPQDLLELAQVSNGAREAADSQLVWREVWWARFGVVWESEVCKKAARRWHLHNWDPKSSAVTQGWKEFFFEFEASWLEWIAAGQNLESSCLVGVHGRLFDITEFMHRHPGSPETLMDNAGADASEIFEDIGHSLDARRLMQSLPSLAPGTGSTRSSHARSSGSSIGGGAGGGGGLCMLASTAQRFREGRALAKREARAVHFAAVEAGAAAAAAAALEVHQVGAAGPAAAVLLAGAEEFVCEECGEAFEPTVLDGDGDAGKARRVRCFPHVNGDLRVFYSPVRGEWGGFFSCCRKHVCFNLPTWGR